MGESFSTFSASVSGSVVNFKWPANSVRNITSVVLQRAPYGNPNAFVNAATLATSATTASDSPGFGNWVYRLKLIASGSLVYSNVAHVTLVPPAGRIVLSVSTVTAPSPIGYTKVSLTWTSVDVEPRYNIFRASGNGPVRLIGRWHGLHGMIFEEVIKAGSGPFSYFVTADLPPEAIGSQASSTQSNTVSVTV